MDGRRADEGEPYLGPRLGTARADLAEQLWSYGEDELALRMLDAPVDVFRRVLDRALNPTCDGPAAAEIARGTVEALTGVARPTARLRARPRASIPEFWRTAGRDPADQPTYVEQMLELRGDRPLPPPYTGPMVDDGRGRGRSPVSDGRADALGRLRSATARHPYLIYSRTPTDEEVYVQTYRLGGGRTMVEHRDGSEGTHRHLVAPTTAAAADLVAAWLDDADGWRDRDWVPGIPDLSTWLDGAATAPGGAVRRQR